jgi:DNA polymerase-1
VSADYSQIEVRVLAHVTGDSGLLNVFRAAGDVYLNMASCIFGRSIETITPAERSVAKTICLGILTSSSSSSSSSLLLTLTFVIIMLYSLGTIYGMGAHTCALRLGIEPRAAQKLITDFFSRFQDILRWVHDTKQ